MSNKGGKSPRNKGQRVQLHFVNLAKERGFEAYNWDKGSSHCPLGDVEIGPYWFSVKGRGVISKDYLPEKPREVGALLKIDRLGDFAVIPYSMLLDLMSAKPLKEAPSE